MAKQAEMWQAWDGFVGSQTPEEFMRISREEGLNTVEAAVAAYIADIPNLFSMTDEERQAIPADLADLLAACIRDRLPDAE